MAPPRSRLVAWAGPGPNDFEFPINPETVDYDRSASYVDVPIALDDIAPGSKTTSSQWNRNTPEVIHVHFVLYTHGKDDVEADLAKLDRLMEKDPRTGEPSDLLFKHGKLRHRVRIQSKSVKDQKKYSPEGGRQWVQVDLTLRVLRPRQ